MARRSKHLKVVQGKSQRMPLRDFFVRFIVVVTAICLVILIIAFFKGYG